MHSPGILVRYEAARNALAECVRVDEVKVIRDKAMAMQVYAKQAKDTELIGYATEIRMRAEIRAGEILDGMEKANGGQVSGRHGKDGSRARPSNRPPTYKELGITKTQASKWQQFSRLSREEQEARIGAAKGKAEQSITKVGAGNGKRYWLTPPDLMEALDREFHFDFDPCPYPRPPGFDGLTVEWGQSNHVNPPFDGITAWVRKAIQENKKGKRVVLTLPMNRWVHRLLEAGADMRILGNVQWRAIEDGSLGSGVPGEITAFILEPPPKKS